MKLCGVWRASSEGTSRAARHGKAHNHAVERTAGSHALAAAAHRARQRPIAGIHLRPAYAFALYRTPAGAVASIHSSLTQWKNLFSFELFRALRK
jgi:hypothetical protein